MYTRGFKPQYAITGGSGLPQALEKNLSKLKSGYFPHHPSLTSFLQILLIHGSSVLKTCKNILSGSCKL
jgi:hypothetical protein